MCMGKPLMHRLNIFLSSSGLRAGGAAFFWSARFINPNPKLFLLLNKMNSFPQQTKQHHFRISKTLLPNSHGYAQCFASFERYGSFQKGSGLLETPDSCRWGWPLCSIRNSDLSWSWWVVEKVRCDQIGDARSILRLSKPRMAVLSLSVTNPILCRHIYSASFDRREV
jgi:hypothetical protein